MKEIDLMEKKELREKMISRTEVLDKVKEVILLPYGECMTMQMVADYFEVGKEAINSIVKRNREELESNGVNTLKEDNLVKFKNNFDKSILNSTKLNKANRSLTIFTRRAILNIAMLLGESIIAKEIRTKLLDVAENKETINKIVNEIDYEKELMLNIMMAKDDMEQAVAVNKLKQYRDEKEAKIKAERDIAVKKVEGLTKSDATWGLREAKTNLGVKEKQFKEWLIANKYMYRQHKPSDVKGKPTGRLKAISEFTQEPIRYFTDINQVDRQGMSHTQTVFTVDGLEFFRTKIDEINSFNK